MATARKKSRPNRPKGTWTTVVSEARRLANQYAAQGLVVTLRQLHYLLVGVLAGTYRNEPGDYKRLSSLTAEQRRANNFPGLSDTTRGVNRIQTFEGPEEALDWLRDIYRRERMEFQSVQVWVLYEKATLTSQVRAWVEDMGILSAALRGYSSESLEAEIFADMNEDGRPVVVFYVGDLDPEGEDIERNFIAQAQRQGIVFHHWKRIGILPAQVQRYTLASNPGKTTSSRAPRFIAKYGRLFQVEIEAMDPVVLRRLLMAALRRFWDASLLQQSMTQETDDGRLLKAVSSAVAQGYLTVNPDGTLSLTKPRKRRS
jgi:hypothetical protein